ncbi:precorrin-3B C(17)-methyltransferase [Solihabitans fulvus]|uniref:Precorrin-3B C(17)-methyltransferase n=1 Tax=Solihabitans fulvus TaxID=1892852 RepID=A0A5B2XW77_9PSEU|nr:precorrin-3B C(17)-methyltransferase [Solihabitans fulvus]KAA2266971.1 precorrin-3B C(17)-methyltransferase [Solihabitans fulvus]
MLGLARRTAILAIAAIGLVGAAGCTSSTGGQASGSSMVAAPAAKATARLQWRPVLKVDGPSMSATAQVPGQQLEQVKAERQSTDPATQSRSFEQLDCPRMTSDPLLGHDDPALPLVTCDTDSRSRYLLGPVFLDGTEVSSVSIGHGQDGKDVVDLNFTAQGTKTWADYTTKNTGEQVAIVVGALVVSAPRINTPIVGGATQITTGVGQDARSLVDKITAK